MGQTPLYRQGTCGWLRTLWDERAVWTDPLPAGAIRCIASWRAGRSALPDESLFVIRFLAVILASSRVLEKALQFHTFDASYVESLCAGDFATQDHFVRYFTELLHLKLRSRLRSPQAIEDVRQETFARVFASLRKGGTAAPAGEAGRLRQYGLQQRAF